jgi:hypothetical protein
VAASSPQDLGMAVRDGDLLLLNPAPVTTILKAFGCEATTRLQV